MIRRCAPPLMALALSACAGTKLDLDGQVCGQPIKLAMIDAKDRSGFTARVECPEGGAVMVTTTESSASAVMAQQAQIMGQLAALLAQLMMAPVDASGRDQAAGLRLAALARALESER